jgi:hypothetical protein
MNEYLPDAEAFLKHVRDHAMTIVREDGVYRHLRFRKPGTSCMGFDIITWPGYLCFCGDMGTYVFQRLQDMLQFFRTKRRDDGSWSIDHRYWAEKVMRAKSTKPIARSMSSSTTAGASRISSSTR